jgi:hypothetical protein
MPLDSDEPRPLNIFNTTRGASSSTIARGDDAPATSRTLSLNSPAAKPFLILGFLFGSLIMYLILAIVPSLTSPFSHGGLNVGMGGFVSAPKVALSPSPPSPLSVPDKTMVTPSPSPPFLLPFPCTTTVTPLPSPPHLLWPLELTASSASGGQPAPATCAEGSGRPPPSPTPAISPPLLLQRHQAQFAWAALHFPEKAYCPIPRTVEGNGEETAVNTHSRRGRNSSSYVDTTSPNSTSPNSSFVSCESWSLRFAVGNGRSPEMDYLPTSFPGLHSLPQGLAGAACPIKSPDTPSEAAWARILSRLTLTAASVEEADGTTPRMVRQPYKILVFGGSEAAGVYCENKLVSWKECAWSARAVSWMRAAFPCADITLYNYATGGTTISAGMASLHVWLHTPPDTDLLFVDFIVNDAFYDQVTMHRPIGVVPTSVSAAYEQFILQTRASRPDLEIVFVNTCALPRCVGLVREIANLAAHYGIPVISYADVVGEASITAEVCLKDISPQWWGPPDQTHPRWQVHQLMAETVQDCFVQRWGSYCSAGTRSRVPVSLTPMLRPATTLNAASDLQKVSTCDNPTTFYSALELIERAKRGEALEGIESHNWPLTEDRANKPGFIAESSDAEIKFAVRFGDVPRLIMTYLRSYEGLGNVQMSFMGIPFPPELGGAARGDRSIVLEGLYASGSPELAAHVSQSFLLSLQVQHEAFQIGVGIGGLDGVVGFGINPGASHTLRFKATGGDLHKFKLLTVTAC